MTLSTLSDRGVLDLTSAAQPQPMVRLSPGDGYSYRVGAVPIALGDATRLLFIFGGDSFATVQAAYVLDQKAAHINFDTFARLFKSPYLEARHLFVGWLAMRAIFGLPVTIDQIDSWDIRTFDQMTGKGAASDIIGDLKADWTAQLNDLRSHLGLI